MYVMSVRQQRVSVELVGKEQVEERQRHLEFLKVATLIYGMVCSAGPHGQLKAACPSTLLTICLIAAMTSISWLVRITC